jgi:hypothetical protein
MSNPRVRNCIFLENFADHGGAGMSNYGTSLGEAGAILENCVFEGNLTSGLGGGLYFSGLTDNVPCKMYNVAFLGNRSDSYSAFGGGCFITNNSGNNMPEMLNCTFQSNLARFGGGLFLRVLGGTLNPTITISVFWGNRAFAYDPDDVRSGIQSDGGASFSLAYSLLQDSTITSNGNISGTTDPKLFNVLSNPFSTPSLKADFRLLPCSPLINAGTNTGITANDVYNKPRNINGTVDIGAYEYRGNTSSTIIYVNKDALNWGDGTSWLTAYNKINEALNPNYALGF